MRIRFYIYCICLISANWCSAQHVLQNSLFMYDRYAFNPAFGGIESGLAANLLYRNQWAGLPGNPETYMIDAHMPFYLWKGAIGLELFNESISAEDQTAFLLSYNHIIGTNLGLWSVGLRAGLSQERLDG